jgi:hypothetical protein
VEVLDQGIGDRRAVAPPDGEDRELAVEADEALENERRGAQLRPRPLDVARISMRYCPLPSYPKRRVFSTAGQPRSATARASSARLPTGRHGGTGTPTDSRKRFSVTRSCETSSARGGGKTRVRPARRSAELTGTFSNS